MQKTLESTVHGMSTIGTSTEREHRVVLVRADMEGLGSECESRWCFWNDEDVLVNIFTRNAGMTQFLCIY